MGAKFVFDFSRVQYIPGHMYMENPLFDFAGVCTNGFSHTLRITLRHWNEKEMSFSRPFLHWLLRKLSNCCRLQKVRRVYISVSVRWRHINPRRTTVYPKKYAHGFVVLCFVVVMQSFIMNSHEVFIHIHQGCFAGTGAIVRLPQCQWSKPDGYGEISQCITTTKHSKAKTACIFLGIYCTCLIQLQQYKDSNYMHIVWDLSYLCIAAIPFNIESVITYLPENRSIASVFNHMLYPWVFVEFSYGGCDGIKIAEVAIPNWWVTARKMLAMELRLSCTHRTHRNHVLVVLCLETYCDTCITRWVSR